MVSYQPKEPNVNMKKLSPKTKKILYWCTVAVLAIVIVVCAVMIGHKLITDAQDKKEYENLQNIKSSLGADVTRPTPPAEPEEPTTSEPTESQPATEPEIMEHLQPLYDMNQDMVGWIEIPGTRIDYPVVQSKYEANYYLRRNFYKEYAVCGTIYAREACDVFEPSDNITLYGHAMANQTMFGDLHYFKDKDYWEEHKLIYFDTLYEYHTYEIFAVFNTLADPGKGFSYHLFDTAADQESFDEFVGQCKDLSFYDTGITPEYGDKLITLSTCDRSIGNGRLVVVARRIM